RNAVARQQAQRVRRGGRGHGCREEDRRHDDEQARRSADQADHRPVGHHRAKRLGAPQPVPESMNQAGRGTIRVSRVNGHSVLTAARSHSPLKLLNPRHGGSSAWTYVATYGGGLVSGDALSLDVEIDAEAAALVATQASTKVY